MGCTFLFKTININEHISSKDIKQLLNDNKIESPRVDSYLQTHGEIVFNKLEKLITNNDNIINENKTFSFNSICGILVYSRTFTLSNSCLLPKNFTNSSKFGISTSWQVNFKHSSSITLYFYKVVVYFLNTIIIYLSQISFQIVYALLNTIRMNKPTCNT